MRCQKADLGLRGRTIAANLSMPLAICMRASMDALQWPERQRAAGLGAGLRCTALALALALWILPQPSTQLVTLQRCTQAGKAAHHVGWSAHHLGVKRGS